MGRISEIFTRAAGAWKLARMVAVVSGHRDKAERFAQAYGIPAKAFYSYDSFDAIADNKDTDAVSIGLPNGLHLEYQVARALNLCGALPPGGDFLYERGAGLRGLAQAPDGVPLCRRNALGRGWRRHLPQP